MAASCAEGNVCNPASTSSARPRQYCRIAGTTSVLKSSEKAIYGVLRAARDDVESAGSREFIAKMLLACLKSPSLCFGFDRNSAAIENTHDITNAIDTRANMAAAIKREE